MQLPRPKIWRLLVSSVSFECDVFWTASVLMEEEGRGSLFQALPSSHIIGYSRSWVAAKLIFFPRERSHAEKRAFLCQYLIGSYVGEYSTVWVFVPPPPPPPPPPILAFLPLRQFNKETTSVGFLQLQSAHVNCRLKTDWSNRIPL